MKIQGLSSTVLLHIVGVGCLSPFTYSTRARERFCKLRCPDQKRKTPILQTNCIWGPWIRGQISTNQVSWVETGSVFYHNLGLFSNLSSGGDGTKIGPQKWLHLFFLIAVLYIPWIHRSGENDGTKTHWPGEDAVWCRAHCAFSD